MTFFIILNLKFLDQLERRHCKDTPFFRIFYIGARKGPFLWGLNKILCCYEFFRLLALKRSCSAFLQKKTMDSFFIMYFSNKACSTLKILYVAILEYSTHLKLSPLRKMFCIVVVHQKMGRGSLARVACIVKKERLIRKGCKSYTEKNPIGIFSLFLFSCPAIRVSHQWHKIFCSSPSSFKGSIVLI